MKRLVLLTAALAVLMSTLLLTGGCASQKVVEDTSYATLDTFADVYDAAMQISSRMVASGDMSKDNFKKVYEVAEVYRKSGLTATNAMRDYNTAVLADLQAQVSAAASDDSATGSEDTAVTAESQIASLKTAAIAAVKAVGANYKSLLALLEEFGVTDKLPILKLITDL